MNVPKNDLARALCTLPLASRGERADLKKSEKCAPLTVTNSGSSNPIGRITLYLCFLQISPPPRSLGLLQMIALPYSTRLFFLFAAAASSYLSLQHFYVKKHKLRLGRGGGGDFQFLQILKKIAFQIKKLVHSLIA
ncbi:hypothetical protein PPYR_03331 [Photinus pyralis]|uniref:Uncharacterized protein n=1 Tax=Photinus pyralis TaxID=7054 RepID=A0A5N4A2K7_PHOPY|nr:hypothetical protein PPYR_03331 [Photinus pyralis]